MRYFQSLYLAYQGGGVNRNSVHVFEIFLNKMSIYIVRVTFKILIYLLVIVNQNNINGIINRFLRSN